MSQIAEAPAQYEVSGKTGTAVLTDAQWRALKIASIRGVPDKHLERQFGVAGATIRKRRSRDPEWQAATIVREPVTIASQPLVKEAAKLTETVVTANLDQIATENNLLAAQFAHSAMQESVKTGLVAAPSTWSDFKTAFGVVRTATGQDREGTNVNVSLWGAGAVAIAGAHDPFDSAFDVSPGQTNAETESQDEWI